MGARVAAAGSSDRCRVGDDETPLDGNPGVRGCLAAALNYDTHPVKGDLMRRMLAAAMVAGVLGLLASATAAGAAPKAGPEKVWVTPSAAGTTVKLPGKVLFTGSFSDYGKSITANAKGKPTNKGSYALLILKKGTILVNVSQLGSMLKTSQPQTVNTTSCSANAHVAAPVTLVKGTKTYVGIGGTFTLTVMFAFIGPMKNGKCTQTSNPAATWAAFTGSGTVTFGS